MKIREEYNYYMTEKLYSLCNRKQYFTSGTNQQYNKMFYAAKSENFNCEKVAVIIWTCSENADIDEITKEVKEIYRDIRKRQLEDDIEREEEKRIETLIYGYEEMTM